MDPQHMGSMGGSMHDDTMAMMRPAPLGIPMTRMGSGTSWLPDRSPMRADAAMAGDWRFMFHYLGFVTFDHQVSQRDIDGASQINATDWLMGVAVHPLGAGQLEFRGMVSTEPLTVGKGGYPLLLQSGESYRDAPLHDRQHPHDLFMEVAALYDVPIAHDLGLELYGGPVGEPALGPVAYPHRPSAVDDPFAVLGHHWQDATHITFGVLTAGVFTRVVKLEGSIFNGREPDETRTNFDLGTLDSYSARVTVNPAPFWSASASYGFLKSPDALTPSISQHRVSASVLFEHPFRKTGEWSSALVYGGNLYSDSRQLSNSADLETTLDLDDRNSVFGRIEFADKDATDLALLALPPTQRFNVGAATIGYTRELTHRAGIAFAVGGVLTVDDIPATLRPYYYGAGTPYGFGLFVRLRPAAKW